ncbi:MAG: transporter permease [Paenibacillus sp.]|nr:transporter permease [Paenibacillus sp.]
MRTYKSERLFHLLNNTAILIISLLMLLPLVHMLAVSLSSSHYIHTNDVFLWPKGFNLNAYQYIFGQERLWRSLGITVYITVVGTIVHLFFTVTISYALSRSYMPARSLILKLILLTMIFSISLIPYFLVVRQMNMLNSLWALMIPNALGAWGVFVSKTFMQGLPSELFEAARIDGCSEFGLFARIAIPTSLPLIAAISLFHAVGQWNSYFSAIIFIQDKSLYPLQMLVREIVLVGDINSNMDNYSTVMNDTQPEQLKAALLLYAVLPIVAVYPFLQKYFVKGSMLGSLKE